MNPHLIRFLLLLICTASPFALDPLFAQEYSVLWGKNGEHWTPTGRLPDVSFAGYHHGEQEIPHVPVAANVKDFGAVGDGITDDSEAFIRAIAETEKGAILIPNGKYHLTQIIEITKPNIVLRGESRDGAVLYFSKTLQEIRPNWGATTGGRKTSNYSWSGGFIWVKGNFRSQVFTSITEPAKRGEQWITLSSTEKLTPGQWVDIRQTDTEENTLARHLYTDDPGNMDKILGRTRTSHTTRITAIETNRIQIERPLWSDLRAEWKPTVHAFDPDVREVGIENLTFEFPVKPYEGHFTELGMNAVAIQNAAHSWVDRIRILHADSGIFVQGRFCTVQNVLFQSDRKGNSRNDTGHHGIDVSGYDNLITRFDFQTTFIHDITLTHCAGNVISNGKGINLSFDHHKRVPYSNVFTNIDVGSGTNIWRCGGGADLGKHCAGWGTFWNIRSQEPIGYPRENFGPWSINIVGIHSDQPASTSPTGKWFEPISPDQIHPQNLHEAQLKRRLEKSSE